MYGCGLIQVYHESQDWAHLISDLSLLGHLGLAYIVFSHIESSYCRWSGTQDAWLQNIPVVFVLEGAFAFSWGCKWMHSSKEYTPQSEISCLLDALHSNIVMLFEFASYDGTWKSLAPICVQMALVTFWIALWLHTLFPAIAAQLRSKSLWDSMSVLGMDLQDYPWTPEGLVGDIALSEDETCMDNDAKNIVTYGNIV